MRFVSIVCVVVMAWSIAAWAGPPVQKAAEYWGQWRGPTNSGVAPHGNPPITWTENKNVRWKTKLPGLGSGSPIVWGDRVYVQTAIKTERLAKRGASVRSVDAVDPSRREIAQSAHPPAKNVYEFVVLAFDRSNGKKIWQYKAAELVPHEVGHPDGSLASASPVTDGEHLFAFFGSRGLYALDMDGKLIWSKDFGDMITRRGHGEGSSVALHGDTIVVNWDHEGESFIAALDKRTGAERWRVPRDEVTSWATPLIVETKDRTQVIVSGTGRVRSYDLATGDVLWSCEGMTLNAIPSPVANDQLVYLLSGFRGDALRAIGYAGARGAVTESNGLAWTFDKAMPYVPSPLLYGDRIYFVNKNRAMLSCLDARSGNTHYGATRLDGLRAIYASPVGAANRVYIVGRDGTTKVIKHSAVFEELATNKLDDGFDASPAIVGDELFLRGREYLYCIAKD